MTLLVLSIFFFKASLITPSLILMALYSTLCEVIPGLVVIASIEELKKRFQFITYGRNTFCQATRL